MKNVAPIFKVSTCVLFARESPDPGSAEETLPVKAWSGRLDERDCSWASAKKQLSFEEATGRVIYLAKRSAFSTSAGASKPGVSSAYAKSFLQGATVVPRCFYFVRSNLTFPIEPDGLYWAETDPEQLALAKRPYNDVRLSGEIEGRFFYYTALARHVLPFALLQPSTTVIPLLLNGSKREIWEGSVLKKEGYRKFGDWMEEAERIWIQKRKKKAEKMSLYERLDYQSELTVQELTDEHVVLYNSTGTNVSAVSICRSDLALPLIVEHTVYRGRMNCADEADYLASVLNSSVGNDAIKPFQAMGLMGERHIEKKLMDLPIPLFNPADSRHQALVHVGRQAREKARNFIEAGNLPTSLARRRGLMRVQLKNELTEIDQIVQKLL